MCDCVSGRLVLRILFLFGRMAGIGVGSVIGKFFSCMFCFVRCLSVKWVVLVCSWVVVYLSWILISMLCLWIWVIVGWFFVVLSFLVIVIVVLAVLRMCV